ncbi:MAG TPA: nuclear transport factor 2 family protein [Haliangium sp.]|nr:nuclear transport factor 2 family protein [Haliangium sp.]
MSQDAFRLRPLAGPRAEPRPEVRAESRAELRAAIEDVIYAGCLHLDELRFDAWLELAAPELRYRITAYSPEIRKDMTWLEHDRSGLAALFELLPRHHVDHAQWLRHAVLYHVVQEAHDRVLAVTSLAVHHTAVDVGEAHVEAGDTRIFVVGRYHDRLRLDRGRWLLAERNVRLETRQLGIGTHLIV